MASLRETKNRIKSVKNTEKITKAMKMVAASKLKKAQDAVVKPRAYSEKLRQLVGKLALRAELCQEEPHPLLLDRPIKKKVMVIALGSDRGLCGALNSSVVRMTQRFIVDNQERFPEILVSTLGKKAYEGMSRLGIPIVKRYETENKIYDKAIAKAIADDMCEQYATQSIDAVFLIYNQFKSAITQNVVVERYLPVAKEEVSSETMAADYIYEPSYSDIVHALVSRHFASRLYQSFLESYASEQGARMTAMDNATRNAKEMTDRLTLEYNRARQAAITKELMEIIGGAEAL